MLGYRHAFHAGNHADVLKHVVLLQLVDYLATKDKPFWYIDTHAGAGRYTLTQGYAAEKREYVDGVEKLWNAGVLPEALARYVELVRALNPHHRLKYYPGSPWIARMRMRPQDRLWLHELHPADYALLEHEFAAGPVPARVLNEDGYAGLRALLPPEPRRALVLIDPSYELREDYVRLLDALRQALRRFATGVFMVWYPMIPRRESRELPGRLATLAPGSWLRAELVVCAADAAHGLYGSGVFVVNPPWTLRAALEESLPRLTMLLGLDRHATFTLEGSAG
jgi:23S rRNA (adenine2030-N6)-methyltransferase